MYGKNKFMEVIRKQAVDIEFTDISFSIGEKEILHSVNGQFSAGQLVAILGASGAGKSTLLNVLTGQLLPGVRGKIFINKEPWNMRKFKKISAYLMQDHLPQPLLTVQESMSIASYLKLGNKYSRAKRIATVNDMISKMGLNYCVDTRVEKLSGGERKRLSLALELINNPPIIFLDEPITGLDNVAIRNCAEILKCLANQGRTIICTIHKPSHSIFQLFEIVYFLSDGYCVYNGTVAGLVPFLSKLGFDCPLTYSPSDYILEVLHFNATNTSILHKESQNGKTIVTTHEYEVFRKEADFHNHIDEFEEFPLGFYGQVKILLYRKRIQLKRSKTLALEILHHVMCGVFLGMLFYNVGNSGIKSIANVNLYFGTVVYLMYTHMLIPIGSFPAEVKLLRREYLNGWYTLKAYFLALSISTLPVMVLTALLHVAIVYPMTGQPMEFERFFWYFLICIVMSLTTQGVGYAIGSIFKPQHGGIIMSIVSAILVVAAIYNEGHADESSHSRRILMPFNFFYDGWVAITTAMLNNRRPFECEKVYCYFGDPKFLLKKLGMEGKNQYISIAYLCAFMIVFKLLSYVSLGFRVSQRYSLITMKLKPIKKLLNLD